MGSSGLGSLTAKLLLDNKDAIASADRFEQRMQALEKRLQTTGQSLVLYGADGQVVSKVNQDLGSSTDDLTNKHDRHGKVVEGSIPTIRQFRQEQRLQNFVARESSQSLLALTFAIGMMTQGNDGASESTKQVEHSLMAALVAANGAEFALYALSRSMIAAGGSAAVVGAAVGQAILPIMVLIGLGAGIFAFFNSMNEEAKKAADEGLKDFTQAWTRLSEAGQLRFGENIEQRIGRIKDEMLALGRIKVGPEARPYTPEERQRLIALQAELEMWGKIRETTKDIGETAGITREYHEAAQQALATQGERLLKIDALIKSNKDNLEARKDLITNEALTDEQIVEALDNINVLEGQRDRLLMSSADKAKEHVDLSELLYKSGSLTLQQLIAAYEASRLYANSDKERAEIDDRIATATQEDLDARYKIGLITESQYRTELQRHLEAARNAQAQASYQEKLNTLRQEDLAALDKGRELGQITISQYADLASRIADGVKNDKDRLEILAKIRSAIEEERKAREAIETMVADSRTANITESYARQREEETQTLRKRIDAIAQARTAAIKAGTDVQTADLLAASAVNEALTAFILKRRSIDVNEADEVAKIRIDSIVDEDQRTRAKFDFEQKQLDDQLKRREISEEKYDALSKKLATERAQAEADLEERHLQSILDGATKFADGLGKILGESGNKFIQGLQIALQIMQQIATINALMKAGKGSETAGSFLGLLGSILSLAALSEGGELPGGGFVVNRTQSRRYAGLLDTLGASTVSGGIPGRDSVFARSGRSIVAMMPGERIVHRSFAGIARAVNEGRVRTFEYGGPVDRNGAIVNYVGGSTSRTDLVVEIARLGEINARLASTLDAFSSKGLKGQLSLNNGQLFLRQEQPALQKFLNKKLVPKS